MTRTDYIVKYRLGPAMEFRELEVRAHHETAEGAETRAKEFRSQFNLKDAHLLVQVFEVELPQMAECMECGLPIFKGEMAHVRKDGSYCPRCATEKVGEGYWDLLGDSPFPEVETKF